jgi:hypothetical protein
MISIELRKMTMMRRMTMSQNPIAYPSGDIAGFTKW